RDSFRDTAPTGMAQRVPCRGRPHRSPRLPAADVKPVLGPSEADIKEAAIFLQLAAAPGIAFVLVERSLLLARRQPQRQAVAFAPQQPDPLFGHLQGVGEKHNRGLEALGAVHGQNPHFVALMGTEIALYFDVAGGDPAQKTLQGWGMLAL